MGEQQEQVKAAHSGRTPPYVSFKSFLTLIEDLKTNGLPPMVDRSVLRRFSGGLGSQLLMALKSLGIVDENNKPTHHGGAIVRAYGDEVVFKGLLRASIDATYPFLSDLDLMEATPTMFANAFKVTGAKEDVLRKCRTFYLHAAQFVGIPIGPRILNGSVPRSPSASSGRRKAKPFKTKLLDKGAGEASAGTGGTPDPLIPTSIADKLLAKFPEFNPEWPDELKTKWFEGYERLLTMGDK